MDKIFCKECGRFFENDSKLHNHLKSHKMTMTAYYQKHFPRFDKWTGDLIKFKNKDFYFNSDFNDRRNLKFWLESVPKQEALNYVKSIFLTRKERKDLIYAPCQCELRTLLFPGVKYIKDNIGDYYQFCADLGYINRLSKYKFEKPFSDVSKRRIYIDTRERQPLPFKQKKVYRALKFGDYTMKGQGIVSDCHIERKALGDFYGTLSSGFDRFCREIDRAVEAKSYLVVVIEADINDVYGYTKLPQIRGRVSISPEYVFHNMRTIIQKYNNVQFLFVRDREESVRVIQKIFASGTEYKEVDLQYAYDTKEL